MQAYSKDSTNVSYTYDSSGMRLSKTVNNIQYTYQYNGGKLMHETRGSRILDYFYDSNGQAIAVRYKNNNNTAGTYYYYAYNSRGDIVGLYDESGSLECTYTYDAWGNILSVKNPVGMEMTSDAYIGNLQSLKYRGYYYDYETGLYYLQSRYYDPVTHRFINEDGLISNGAGILGYNMFAYCDNNPICFSDYTGERLDDLFAENKKARLKKGAHERRRTNQSRQNNQTCCPDEVSPSTYISSSTYYLVTAEIRKGHVDQRNSELPIGFYSKIGSYSIENYSPSLISGYVSTDFEFGINTPICSYSFGLDNIGVQRGITIDNCTYSFEASLSINDLCYRVGWDKTTYDGNESFSVIGGGIEVNGLTAALAAVYIGSTFYYGVPMMQGAY